MILLQIRGEQVRLSLFDLSLYLEEFGLNQKRVNRLGRKIRSCITSEIKQGEKLFMGTWLNIWKVLGIREGISSLGFVSACLEIYVKA